MAETANKNIKASSPGEGTSAVLPAAAAQEANAKAPPHRVHVPPSSPIGGPNGLGVDGELLQRHSLDRCRRAGHREIEGRSASEPHKDPSPAEQKYVQGAITCMEATVRSLDTVYKGREMNFKDADELQRSIWNPFKGSTDFGESVKEFLKTLPGLSIGGAGGLTLASMLQTQPAIFWGLGVIQSLCKRDFSRISEAGIHKKARNALKPGV